MKNSKNILLFFISIIIIATSLYIYNSKYLSPGTIQGRSFSISHDEAVSKIKLLSKDDTKVVLELNNRGNWLLNNEHKANESAVAEVITILRNLYIKHPVPVNSKDSVLNLLDSKGVSVEIYSKRYAISIGNWKVFSYNKKLNSIIIGSDTENKEGTFMKKRGSDNPYVVHIPGQNISIQSVFIPSPYEWKDPVIVNLTWPEIEKIEFKDYDIDSESFTLKNDNNEFILKDNKNAGITFTEFDSLKVQRFISVFEGLFYDKILYGEEKHSVMKALSKKNPVYSISVFDVYSNSVKIEIYNKLLTESEKEALGVTTSIDPNILYMIINDKDYAIARYFVFSRVLRPLSFYRKKSS